MAMSDPDSNLGPSSTRRRLATLIAVVGIVVVAERLVAHWPRGVEVAYEVSPDVTELDVDYVYEGGAVASARFRQPDSKRTVFRHSVKLQPGDYQVLITLYRPGGPATEDTRMLRVPAKGVTRFDLREITTRSK
jgi:hypothetical protein